ncbi:MAG: glycosyl hydrolase family 18 [Microbacterium sp.]|uniref:carbohydrate-binding protein n=1 Tax=Microbacterium sp. TaxID=51671 RepID=UPI002722962A|nr:carbohydrate-binding protein [Microbacterium sp.]MDO8383308.1 glycosyl hydrolase family 18 [Microbacterium sp.]
MSTSSVKSGRHPGKRLSPWRVSAAVITVLALVGVAVVVPYVLREEASAEPSAVTGPRWFGGYFDVTSAKVSDMPTLDKDAPANIVLSFIVAEAEDSCEPSWGTFYSLEEAGTDLDLDRRIARMRQEDAEVAVSFGGALNTELAVACTDVESLSEAYAAVLDRYDITTMDLDIEAGNLADSAAGSRRALAVAQLQEERWADGGDLDVWITLPVATDGLTTQGIAAVQQLLAAGVDLGGVNVMTMDYNTDLGGATMAEASISALEATSEQLTRLYTALDIDLPSEGAWAVMGATPMIGQNDVESEVFTLKDAKALNAFAESTSLARMSMWSLNRDRTCGPNYPNLTVVSNGCSGVDQGDETFAQVLAAGFDGRPDPGPTASATPTSTPVIKDDPDTSPYPIWSEGVSYSAGVRIVWQGNVYVSKWWTNGDIEPNDPSLSADQTPWTLVGPVLAVDAPWTLPTVAPGTYPEWSPAAVYVTGDRVLLNGTPFEAQWWTQGDDPAIGILDHDRSPWEIVTGE